METTNLSQEELASSDTTSVDQRWQRLFQTKSYPYGNTAIGGDLCPDREVEDLHDYARFLEITNRSPFPVFQLARTCSTNELFLDANVFIYHEPEEGKEAEVHTPPNFKEAYEASAGFNGLKVAMTMSVVKEAVEANVGGPGAPSDKFAEEEVEYEDVNTFSAIVIDEARNVVHRIDPDQREKKGLDDAIEKALADAGCTCNYIRPGTENNGDGPSYWKVNFHELPELTSYSFVLYKQACFWQLETRLAFSDMSHDNVFNDYVERWNSLDSNKLNQMILNWYVSFTNDANFHAFGDAVYVGSHESAKYMPCYVVQMNNWLRNMSYDYESFVNELHFELNDCDCDGEERDCDNYTHGD